MLPTRWESILPSNVLTKMTSSKPATILPLTEDAAWRRYLELTRDVDAADYAEREAEAWEELQAALERLPARPDDAA